MRIHSTLHLPLFNFSPLPIRMKSVVNLGLFGDVMLCYRHVPAQAEGRGQDSHVPRLVTEKAEAGWHAYVTRS